MIMLLHVVKKILAPGEGSEISHLIKNVGDSAAMYTRNQEIFGQKLADYAVDCLWIFSYSNAISRGKMTCII